MYSPSIYYVVIEKSYIQKYFKTLENALNISRKKYIHLVII